MKRIVLLITVIALLIAVPVSVKAKGNHTTRINITIGICGENGDGTVIDDYTVFINNNKMEIVKNEVDPQYNYISYVNVKEACKGNTIVTLSLLNPENSEPDDILSRLDFIME